MQLTKMAIHDVNKHEKTVLCWKIKLQSVFSVAMGFNFGQLSIQPLEFCEWGRQLLPMWAPWIINGSPHLAAQIFTASQ